MRPCPSAAITANSMSSAHQRIVETNFVGFILVALPVGFSNLITRIDPRAGPPCSASQSGPGRLLDQGDLPAVTSNSKELIRQPANQDHGAQHRELKRAGNAQQVRQVSQDLSMDQLLWINSC